MPSDFLGGVGFILEKYGRLFLRGLGNTLVLALLGTLFGLLLGIIISLIRQINITDRDSFLKKSLKKLGHVFSITYIQYLRGTPMLVQGMMFHLIMSNLGFRNISMPLGILVISINTSAYMAEILRASIQAIDPGQMEAARSIGMTETQAMRYFILPQSLRNAIPAFGNEFVVNAKDSSVLNAIAVAELFYQANLIGSITYRYLEPLFVISLVYLTITIISTKILNYVEHHLDAPKGTYPTSMTHEKHHFRKKGFHE